MQYQRRYHEDIAGLTSHLNDATAAALPRDISP
jgi:hypothetical protein